MTPRVMAAIGVWAVFVVAAAALGVAASPLWFAVSGVGALGLLLWFRQLRAVDRP